VRVARAYLLVNINGWLRWCLLGSEARQTDEDVLMDSNDCYAYLLVNINGWLRWCLVGSEARQTDEDVSNDCSVFFLTAAQFSCTKM